MNWLDIDSSESESANRSAAAAACHIDSRRFTAIAVAGYNLHRHRTVPDQQKSVLILRLSKHPA